METNILERNISARKILLAIFFFCIMFSGCMGPQAKVEPLAGLDVTPAPGAYKNLNVGVILSENYKNLIEYGRKHAWMNNPISGQSDLDKVENDLVRVFRRNFKTAVKLEKMEDAQTAQVDVIAIYDLNSHGSLHIKIDAALLLYTPDRREIDTVKATNVKYTMGRNIYEACAEVTSNLEKSLLASAKLKEYADTITANRKSIVSDTSNTVKETLVIPDFKDASRQNDLAIVIGIENYRNLPKSDFSKIDAESVKGYLKAMGFKDRNINCLTNDMATKTDIEKTVEAWLPNRIKSNSVVFFYYSGHGSPDPVTQEVYLVPFDGDPNYLSVTGYPMKRLYDNLGKLQVSEVIVILDACFSGAGGRSVLAKGARPLVINPESMMISPNMVVLSASQGAQISISSQEKGHGVFTYYFLKALSDGKKSIVDIYEYIKPQVEDEAKTLNVQQIPNLNPAPNELNGKFQLRK